MTISCGSFAYSFIYAPREKVNRCHHECFVNYIDGQHFLMIFAYFLRECFWNLIVLYSVFPIDLTTSGVKSIKFTYFHLHRFRFSRFILLLVSMRPVKWKWDVNSWMYFSLLLHFNWRCRLKNPNKERFNRSILHWFWWL